MARTVVSPDGLPDVYASYGLAPAALSDGFVFTSGMVGARPDGSVPDDPAEQIDQAFQNLRTVLEAVGATFDDIVDTTAFYTDYESHGSLAGVARRKYFGAALPPTWTAVGVTALAAPFVFEMKCVVRVPQLALLSAPIRRTRRG